MLILVWVILQLFAAPTVVANNFPLTTVNEEICDSIPTPIDDDTLEIDTVTYETAVSNTNPQPRGRELPPDNSYFCFGICDVCLNGFEELFDYVATHAGDKNEEDFYLHMRVVLNLIGTSTFEDWKAKYISSRPNSTMGRGVHRGKFTGKNISFERAKQIYCEAFNNSRNICSDCVAFEGKQFGPHRNNGTHDESKLRFESNTTYYYGPTDNVQKSSKGAIE